MEKHDEKLKEELWLRGIGDYKCFEEAGIRYISG